MVYRVGLPFIPMNNGVKCKIMAVNGGGDQVQIPPVSK